MFFCKFQLPDEMTLRAMAAKYANELSGGSPPSPVGAPNTIGMQTFVREIFYTENKKYCFHINLLHCSHILGNSTSRSTTSVNWTTQGLPLLEFQQQVLHQLREIWVEERRKLQLSTHSHIMNPLNSGNIATAVNPSSICNNENSAALLGASSSNDFLIHNLHHHQYSSNGDQHLVGGFYHHSNNSSTPPTLPAPNNVSSAGMFSSTSQFNNFTSNSSELHHHHTLHSQNNRGTPSKLAGGGGLEQQQRHQYLEPVIITNSPSTSKHHHQKQIHKYQPPPPITIVSGIGGDDGRLNYTPGIYQVSVQRVSKLKRCKELLKAMTILIQRQISLFCSHQVVSVIKMRFMTTSLHANLPYPPSTSVKFHLFQNGKNYSVISS